MGYSPLLEHREQGVIPFRILSGNRPYSVFKEMKHYHRRADKSSFFLEVPFSKGLADRARYVFFIDKRYIVFYYQFCFKIYTVRKNSMKNNGLEMHAHFSRFKRE
jgi:hypothetical protein